MGDLRVEVEFLTGRCAAADPFQREKAEWPPAPARLFAALASAAFETNDEEGLQSLRWLEVQPPPLVHAGQMTPRLNQRDETPGHFVPVNDTRSNQRKRVLRVFPSVSLSDPVIQFVWQGSEPPSARREALARLAALVPYLGESASAVRVALTDSLTQLPALEPTTRGEVFLRVPFAGQLDELARNFELNVNPAAGVQQAYRRHAPLAAKAQSLATSAETPTLFLFRLGGHPNYSVTHALQITAAVRQTLVALAGSQAKTVPPILHGHGPDGGRLRQNHIIVAPLPFVTGNRADGRVLGFMIILPPGLPDTDRRACYRAVESLEVLRLSGGNEFPILRCHTGEPARTLRPESWTGPARVWATVTPTVLNRFPGKRPDKTIESIITSMCRHIDLPSPAAFVFQASSFARAVPHARHFLTRRPHWRPLPHGHLRLEFTEPVSGPIVIGSCRHYGLGLMAPLPEETS
jgi:CRISPR-associated protein Csb2